MSILITGCSGFVGFHVCNLLLKKKLKVCGVDNLNNYYDVNLKKARLSILKKNTDFFYKADIANKKKYCNIFLY